MTLSTHVLDTMHGRPAAGIAVRLHRGEALLFESTTDADGRCPALRELAIVPGAYTIDFAVAEYFRGQGVSLPVPPFLDRVRVDFGISGDGHYHVPLLVSPFGYSTYRGS
ncbi:hydroxyisourate hydrolase [Sphingomonas sp. MMS12-HWE2-04]|uniref:hydroxyisourate hydrolase n=1 Tax=Sphingomonas sp. MMS12-HWE2-04 TaxID=3234199 RepID=UPI00384F91EF